LFKLHLIVGIDGRLPFSLDDASRPESDFEAVDSQFNRVHLDTRLNHRVLDLRVCYISIDLDHNSTEVLVQTETNQAIFKLQSAIGGLFRDFLNEKGFLEIHTPKLQGAATESGASVFKVGYFKSSSWL
jgi:aspartyl/asparaginyl-tRNA synthetase